MEIKVDEKTKISMIKSKVELNYLSTRWGQKRLEKVNVNEMKEMLLARASQTIHFIPLNQWIGLNSWNGWLLLFGNISFHIALHCIALHCIASG
jgi:hypothetical protein